MIQENTLKRPIDIDNETALKPIARFPVVRVVRHTQTQIATSDAVIEETPVALQYNGVSHVVLLATPDDALLDLALGFSLSEGILTRQEELIECDLISSDHGTIIEMLVSNRAFTALKDRRRVMAGRTGCGLCGVENLSHVSRHVPKVSPPLYSLKGAMIFEAIEENARHQILRQHTGATHSAAWFDSHGRLGLLREDVGRHNALDKLLGGMARQKLSFREGFIFISSRASFEMVQKAAMLGVGVLIAASAPTGAAIRLAEETGVCLIGFARADKLVMYTARDRVTF